MKNNKHQSQVEVGDVIEHKKNNNTWRYKVLSIYKNDCFALVETNKKKFTIAISKNVLTDLKKKSTLQTMTMHQKQYGQTDIVGRPGAAQKVLDQSMSKWRECDDPDELAAAVEAGVRVERSLSAGESWWMASTKSADDFALHISCGYRYRVPTWWSLEWTPLPAPPDGCEAIYLPTATVDYFAIQDYRQVHTLVDACREAQARRPKPEPRTEWVPWWEAKGRIVCFAGGSLGRCAQVGDDAYGPYVWIEGEHINRRSCIDTDGKVEVLVEDDDQ